MVLQYTPSALTHFASECIWWQVDVVISSPLRRAQDTALPILDLQALSGNPRPEMLTSESLTDRDWGTFQGRLVQEVVHLP